MADPAPTLPLPADTANLEAEVYVDEAGNVTICPPAAVVAVSAPPPGEGEEKT